MMNYIKGILVTNPLKKLMMIIKGILVTNPLKKLMMKN